MNSNRSTTLALFCLLAALGGPVAACAPGNTEAQTPSTEGPSVTGIPRFTSTSDELLPIEGYLISADESDRIERARSALIGACMKRFGYDYTPETPDQKQRSNQTEHRYDPTSQKAASRYGYHPPVDAQEGGEQELATPPTREMLPVLRNNNQGSSSKSGGTVHNGLEVPDGGCVGEADRKLTSGGGIIQDAELAIDINFRNYTRSMADARVKEAFSMWSACMKDGGYSYPTPVEAINDPEWRTKKPSSREIATATLDVACKKKHNVVGIWFTVESAYEKDDIKKNIEELRAIRKAIDKAVQNAATAVEQ